MSPESTLIYYRRIVHRHQEVVGDHSYPRIVIASVSFQQYITWQHDGEWDEIGRGLEAEFRAVAAAGADFALLATNTMHKVLPSIESPVPVLNILDVISRHALGRGLGSVGLTGTAFTMGDGFYARGLEERGLRVVLPNPGQQERIHRIIYDELIVGRVERSSVKEFAEITSELSRRGAEVVLLGCTELGLLAGGDEFGVEMIDSTSLHADAAWETAMGAQIAARDATHSNGPGAVR
jgi:aspartate racemase